MAEGPEPPFATFPPWVSMADADRADARASKRSRSSVSTSMRAEKTWFGMVAAPGQPSGPGSRQYRGTTPHKSKVPMHLTPRCLARTRAASPCQSPAMANGRCRMHGGKRIRYEKDGDLTAIFRQPFDILVETVRAEAHVAAGRKAKSAKREIWLPISDAAGLDFSSVGAYPMLTGQVFVTKNFS
jgi:hypothetical protein